MKIDYWQKFEENIYYHIYNRSIDGLQLFKDKEDYQKFLVKYDKYLRPYMDLIAYCLIPNHFHFLVKVKPVQEVLPILNKEETNAALRVVKMKASINEFLEDQMRRYFSSSRYSIF